MDKRFVIIAITSVLILSLLITSMISIAGTSSTQAPVYENTKQDSSSKMTSISSNQSSSHVELQGSVPTLFVNNQSIAPTSLFIYNVESTIAYDSQGWLDTFRGYVDTAKNTGFSYISFELYYHSPMFNTTSKPPIPGNETNFSKMDALFDYAQQQGIYLLPTIWVSNPPEWWAKEHRDELQISYNESIPPTNIMLLASSFNNSDYWIVMDAYLKVLVERYRSHPALLGWSPCIGMTHENNYGPSYLSDPFNQTQAWADYSPFAKDRFRTWLTERYGTDATLRSAWSNYTVNLSSAQPPMPGSPVVNAVEAANSAGDMRKWMRDWLEFRLDEKGSDWKHFVDTVKSLDPDHIIVMNPADPLFASIGASTKNGAVDGLELTRYQNVDMVIIHPRISYNETEGSLNTQNFTLFSFAAYARRLGMIGTFSLEDTGDTVNKSNIESYDRIASIAPMLASAGGGMGWVRESTRSSLPVWSDAELAKVAEYTYLYEPENRSVNVPEIAILLDPAGEQTEYALGGTLGFNSRGIDRKGFYRNLFNAGIRIDPIEIAEVSANPHVLDGYRGVVIANIAKLNESVAQTLHDYAQSGKGLFVAGRTGIYDSEGNQNYSSLKALLGLSSMPTGNTSSYITWNFSTGSDPLLAGGLSGQQADNGNLYYIPLANWTDEGFTELGYAASGTQPATLLRKGKTIAWFSRLDIADDDLMVTFFRNWMDIHTGTITGRIVME